MERNHSSHTHSLPVYILPTDSSGRAPTHASTVPGSFGPGVGLGRGKIHNAGVESGSAVYVLSEAISPTDNVDLNTHGNDLVQLSSKSLDYYQREMGSAGTLDDWDWDNGTMYNTSLGGDADTFSWGILLLAPLVVFGIAGNTLVILAISLERRLQNVTNYFLLSLAVTDLLVSLIVMPLSIINEFTGQWMFGLILCNLFVTADVFMCTSSILHLCTISLERYIGIRYPLWTKNKSKRTVFLKIVLVWTIAIAITSPITVLGIVSADNIYQDGQCSLNNQHFIIYGSIFAFFIPLLIMVVMYALTVRMLNRQAQLCGGDKEREGEPMIRRSTSRRHWQRQNRHSDLSASSSASTRNSYHREPLAATTSYPLGPSAGNRYTQRYQPLGKRNTIPLYKMRKERDQTSSASRDITEFEHCNGNEENLEGSPRRGTCWRTAARKSLQQADSCDGEPKRLKELVRKHHVAVKAANILLMRRDFVRKENSSVQTEQKASKVLGVVFMIFVVCWAPFFLVNILTVLCVECYFPPTLFTVFVWLGYVSSTLNPIIYTVFNKIFKLTFLKLLCCRYGLLHRGRRRSNGAGFALTGRGGSGGSNSHSGLITCNSFCGHGASNDMEESMC